MQPAGCGMLARPPSSARHTARSVSFFFLKHASDVTAFILFCSYFFPLGSSMGFNKGFFWSKPLVPHHKQNPQNPSHSRSVLLSPSGFLVAFGWGMAISQCLRKLSTGKNIRQMLPGQVVGLLESRCRCGAGRDAPGGLGTSEIMACIVSPIPILVNSEMM